MDLTNWTYLYKKDYISGHNVTTNMLYTPMISPDGFTMCMLWDENHPYQHESTRLTKDLINFCFEREVKHLTIMQKFLWAPRLLSIDQNKIFIEFNKESLNHIMLTPGRSLDIECPTWKEQIFNIIKDILNEGYYKVALYPHCFFLKDGQVKTFDFYSCVSIEERYIERTNLEGLIGEQSTDRFNISTVDGRIDFKKFFEVTMLHHLATTWRENPFPKFYERLI